MNTEKQRIKVAGDYPGSLVVSQPQQIAASVHPGRLIDALMQNPTALDIDKMRGLFELQKDYDAELARKAYHAARARFSAIAPTILHNAEADFTVNGKRTHYGYADLAGTMDQIRGALDDCGLNANWKLDDSDPARIAVTCYVTHDLGHQESTTLSASRGAGKGNTGMNDLQALKSTTSYLERITLFALLGLAARGDDDDGEAGDTVINLITDEQAYELDALVNDNELNKDLILNWLANSAARAGRFEDIPVEYFDIVRKKIQAVIKQKAS